MNKLLTLFKTMLFGPMVLLLGASGDPAGTSSTNASGEPPAASEPPATSAPTAGDIANELLSAIEKRSQRVEGSITKSIAEKYGMTEDEVSGILAAEKERRDKALPAEVQKQIDDAFTAANDRLIGAEIRTQAAVLGFVDADDALKLIDRSELKVDDKGNVTGVKEALEALAKAKPHLVKRSGAWGERHGSASNTKSGVEAEFEKLNPHLKI